jgi:hypothetical protein
MTVRKAQAVLRVHVQRIRTEYLLVVSWEFLDIMFTSVFVPSYRVPDNFTWPQTARFIIHEEQFVIFSITVAMALIIHEIDLACCLLIVLEYFCEH